MCSKNEDFNKKVEKECLEHYDLMPFLPQVPSEIEEK
jgi:hypothetical protein